MSLLKTITRRSFQIAFKLNTQTKNVFNTTRRFKSHNFNYKQQYGKKSFAKPVVTIGFLGWLFGNSVDYESVRKDIIDILEDYGMFCRKAFFNSNFRFQNFFL